MRNSFLIATCIVIFIVSTALAGFPLKSGVYRINQLDTAKAEALSRNKAIAFIYSDENTTCPLCAGASIDAINYLSDVCEIVYVDKNTDWEKLPELVRQAINSPAAGRFIPKTIIVDAQIEKVIAIAPYVKTEERKELLDGVKDQISRNK